MHEATSRATLQPYTFRASKVLRYNKSSEGRQGADEADSNSTAPRLQHENVKTSKPGNETTLGCYLHARIELTTYIELRCNHPKRSAN